MNLAAPPSRVSGMTLIPTPVPVAFVLGAALLAAGCGKTVTIGDSGPAGPAPAGNDSLQLVASTAAENGRTDTGGTVVGTQAQERPPVWVQLSAVTSPPLNRPHLININQAVLYRFDEDSADPPASSCYGECATTWPPVTVEEKGSVYLAGVPEQNIGAIRRQDGAVQLTVGGWPVYRFARDEKPGDLNGQGVGGTWFAVGPDGERVR